MNNKKKILFLVTQSEFGGAQRFIYTLIRGLTQINPRQVGDTQIDAEFIVAAGPDGDDENGLLNALENKGINTIHLKYLRRSINPFFDILGLFEIKKLLKKEKPDILFLCSSKAGFLGSLAARSVGIRYRQTKIIYRIGGWTFNDPWPKWKKKLYIWIEKRSAKWKDYIINNAESDRKQAIELGIKPRKEILLIYNGIGNLKFLPREEARRMLNTNYKIQDTIVGTIANDYPAKGLKYFKEAIKSMNNEQRTANIKLIIIGKGNRFIPNAYKYLKAFDVFVLPSIKEGFPWTILEAMAAEVPIIATKVAEIVENNENGILVESRNPKKIAEAIRKLIGDKNLREKLTKNGKRAVEEKFTLKQMMKKYEDLFFIN